MSLKNLQHAAQNNNHVTENDSNRFMITGAQTHQKQKYQIATKSKAIIWTVEKMPPSLKEGKPDLFSTAIL